MRFIGWQFYPSLKFGLNKTYETIDGFGKKYRFIDYWVCLGPIQLRFREERN